MKVSKHQIRNIIQEEVSRAKSLLQEADTTCNAFSLAASEFPYNSDPNQSGWRGWVQTLPLDDCNYYRDNCGGAVAWDETRGKCVPVDRTEIRHMTPIDCDDPDHQQRYPVECGLTRDGGAPPPLETQPPGILQPPGVAYLDNDPGCFDGRSSSYTHDGRDYGDWIYKIAGYDDDRNPYFEMVEKFGGMEQAAASDIGWIEMEVYKVTERGTSGRASANAKCSRTGFKFKLSDIKPRDSEEASHWTVHPLTRQVLGCINNDRPQWDNFTIECPPGVCS